MELTRRGFLASTALGAAGAIAGTANVAAADEGPAEGARMTDEEVLAALLDEAEVTEDYVQSDGTVVPALYLRLRNRLNRIGVGVGSEVHDGSWDLLMHVFSEDDAQHWLEMPMFKFFTAQEYAAASGRSEQECLDICEDLAHRGLLYRVRRGEIAHFHLLPQVHGIWEYNERTWDKEWLDKHDMQWGPDTLNGFLDATVPVYHPVPIDARVVANEEVLPFDSYEEAVGRHSIIAVANCQCRRKKEVQGTLDCEHPIETCLSFGEEAQFYIENGIGRQIDQEEALGILRTAVDNGLVIQHCYSKANEIMCCCHGDCCGLLGNILMAGGWGDTMPILSSYDLQLDKKACIQCGACVDRCPMFAVSFGEDGFPQMAPTCVRCGQCAMVCPVGARTLIPHAPEDVPEMPDTMVDADYARSANRMRKGYITDFTG